MEGAFKCGTREGKGRAENKEEEKHVHMSGGGKRGGMFKELQQDTSKN